MAVSWLDLIRSSSSSSSPSGEVPLPLNESGGSVHDSVRRHGASEMRFFLAAGDVSDVNEDDAEAPVSSSAKEGRSVPEACAGVVIICMS